MRGAVITLLTDFGTADGYVGEMKGVLHSSAPGVTVVDIAHDVPPQDVLHAMLAVGRYWRRFPVRTIHVVIVDPGVGSGRAGIAVESDGRFLVAPDNGVLSPALEQPGCRAVSLPLAAHAAPTFHGRDVFAPAAARLALGQPPGLLGSPIEARKLALPTPTRDGSTVVGEVIAIDRFGNAITNLRTAPREVRAAGRRLAVVRTYADLEPGGAGALVGSSGLIEIVVRDASAAATLGLSRGARVVAG